MNTFLRFFYEFISIFFDGFFSGLKGLWDGFIKMFSFKEYGKVISSYRELTNTIYEYIKNEEYKISSKK